MSNCNEDGDNNLLVGIWEGKSGDLYFERFVFNTDNKVTRETNDEYNAGDIISTIPFVRNTPFLFLSSNIKLYLKACIIKLYFIFIVLFSTIK